jgi:type 1 fimbria pilin
MKIGITIFGVMTILMTGSLAFAAPQTADCFGSYDGNKIEGEIALTGNKTSGTLSAGINVTLETVNQCSMSCVSQKIFTIELAGSTLKSINSYSYTQNPGEGNVEYPILSGVINGKKFNAYCVLK